MRLGLIADIHGNKLALDAVLEQLDYQEVDGILCLGDVATLGPDPGGVVRTLRERNIPVVMGNTDAWLFKPERDDLYFTALTYWTLDQLSESDVDLMRSFPSTISVPLARGVSLLGCHGSPRSYDDVLSASTPVNVLTEVLAGHAHQVIAGGHTHIQLLRRFGQRHFVNPGSVGMPGIGPMYVSGSTGSGLGLDELIDTLGQNLKRGFGIGYVGDEEPDTSPIMSEIAQNEDVSWAEFAIIEAADDGGLSFGFHRIPIDLEALFAAADASGMPHLDWWKAFWAPF
jgi:predicted phosphodiesterase